MKKEKTVRVGKRGMVVIPAAFRKTYHLVEGSLVVAEPHEDGILLRPAMVYPVEIYTPERKAEFFLNNAITKEDYAWAIEQVKAIGLNPKKIPHKKPSK